MLQKKVEDGDLSEGQRDKFSETAVVFYTENLQYTLLKMGVDSSFWEIAQWIDFQSRQDAKWSQVEKGFLQYDDYEMEKLFEEFIDFKSLSDSEVSSAAWKDTIVTEYNDGSKEYRIDTL